MNRTVITTLLGLALGAGGCAEAEFPPELTRFTEHPGNPVFTAQGSPSWEAELRERGWILYEGGSYHLWFTGSDPSTGGRGKLGYATSKDGIAWQRWLQNPIYSEHWIEDVMVVPHEGSYYMFAEGEHDQAQLLISTDRVHWDRVGRIDIRYQHGRPLTPGPYGTPVAFHEDGLWYLFYERQDDGIWLATSPDLRVFTNVQDRPVLTIGPSLHDGMRVAMSQVVKYHGRYYAYYNGQGLFGSWTTSIATSTDRVHWQKYADNPVLPLQSGATSALLIAAPDGLRLYAMNHRVLLFFSDGPSVLAPSLPLPP